MSRRRAPSATTLMVLCCAGPALIAAGTLAAIGTVTGTPWAIGAAGMLVLAAIALTTKRRRFRDAVAALGQGVPTGRSGRHLSVSDGASGRTSAVEEPGGADR